MIPLFNKAGVAIAFADDNCQAIFDAQGTVLAWFDQELLYATTGRYLGWAELGWIYDRDGQPALFTETAFGGLPRPRLQPVKAEVTGRLRWAQLPSKPVLRQPRPARRTRVRHWSLVSALSYFQQ
ncbi:4-fold beta flower protein [Hymenobacter seoulensis]